MTIGTAITVEEAVALDTAGVDAIVASGFEAGGHRVAFLRAAEDSLVGHARAGPGGGRRGAGAGDRRGRDRRPARRDRRARARRRGGAGRDGVPGHAPVGRERRAPRGARATARAARGSRARSPAGSPARWRPRITTLEPVAPFPYQAVLSFPLTSSGDPDVPRLLGRPGGAARARRTATRSSCCASWPALRTACVRRRAARRPATRSAGSSSCWSRRVAARRSASGAVRSMTLTEASLLEAADGEPRVVGRPRQMLARGAGDRSAACGR